MKHIWPKAFLGLALCLHLGQTFAQAVLQAKDASLQALIRRDKDGFLSCGVRAVVINASGKFMDAYDFSVMVDAGFLAGTLKGGKLRIPVSEALKGKFPSDAVLPAPINIWVALESEGKAISMIQQTPSETKGYTLGISDFVESYRGILAIIHGERMQFAIRYKSEPLDYVISFAKEMDEKERTPLMKCLEDVVERLRKDIDKQADKKQ